MQPHKSKLQLKKQKQKISKKPYFCNLSEYCIEGGFHNKVCILDLVQLEDDIGYMKNSNTDCRLLTEQDQRHRLCLGFSMHIFWKEATLLRPSVSCFTFGLPMYI